MTKHFTSMSDIDIALQDVIELSELIDALDTPRATAFYLMSQFIAGEIDSEVFYKNATETFSESGERSLALLETIDLIQMAMRVIVMGGAK